MDSPNDEPPLSDLQSVIDWTGFKSADAKYRALVSISEKDGWELCDGLSHYTGTAELSVLESEVFGIDAPQVPALYWAYERYENLNGAMDEHFGEFTDQERIDHSTFYRGDRQWSFDLAVGFMVSACGLPAPQCFGWVSKIVAAQVRGGLYSNS
jgi:hypothetical protein